MTDFGRRGEIPPPEKFDEIEVSRWAVFVAALGILAERARSSLRISELNGWAERSVEAIRQRLFSRWRSAREYDEPRSEMIGLLGVLPPDILGLWQCSVA